MHRFVRTAATAVVTGLVLTGGTAPQAAEARPYCEPASSYKLYKDGWSWYRYDAGTLVNKSKKATIHKSIQHSTSESRTTTKSAEIGGEVSYWVVKINAKFGYSTSKTVSYTRSTTFTIDVPPKSKVKYRDGIIVRHFKVKKTRLFDNCQTKVTWHRIGASDNLTKVWDA